MQDRRLQLLAGGHHLTVKIPLRLIHQAAQAFRIPFPQADFRPADNGLVIRAEGFLHPALRLIFRKGKGLIQIPQNPNGILGGHQIRDHPMKGGSHPELMGIDFHSVELHEDRLDAISTGLIQPPAAGRRTLLPPEGRLHFALNIHPQMIELIKGPGHEHADRRRGGKAALQRQIPAKERNLHPADAVIIINIRRDTRHIGKIASLLRRFQETGGIHFTLPVFLGRNFFLAAHDKPVRTLRPGINPLLRAADNGPAFFNRRIHRTVHTGPVRMLTEKA